jgi:chemotaxis receptor (MCP) glutamine deamidase CheD
MLIGGKRVWGNLASKIAALKELPSGFKDYTPQKDLSYLDEASENYKEFEKTQELFYKLYVIYEQNKTYDQSEFQGIIGSLKNFLSKAEKNNNLPEQAFFNGVIGFWHSLLGNKKEAINYQIKSGDLYTECSDNMTAINRFIFAYNLGVPEYLLKKDCKNLRDKIANLWVERHGEKKDHNAYRVEQREIGFSSEEKIGTDNIKSCICVIIRDQITKKTALAHIDDGTYINSFEKIFERLPDRSSSNELPLECKIIGGTKFAGNESDFKNTSQKNLTNVIKFLDNKRVNVLSTDILDENQATSVVVDPKTFNIKFNSPAKNPKELARYSFIGAKYTDLQVSFDFTISKDVAPVLFDRNTISGLKEKGTKSEKELLDLLIKNNYPEIAIPNKITETITTTKQLYEVQNYLKSKVADKAKQLSFDSTKQLEECFKTLENVPVHVGVNSDKCNKELFDFIDNNLFKRDNQQVSLDLEGLNNFNFSKSPIDLIEAGAEKQSFQAKHRKRSEESRAV